MAGQASSGSWDLVRFLAALSGIKLPRTEVSVPMGLEDPSGPGLRDSRGQEHLRGLQRTSWGPCPEALETRLHAGRCPEGPIGGGLYRAVEGTAQVSRNHKGCRQRRACFPANTPPHCPLTENPCKGRNSLCFAKSGDGLPASARSASRDG